MFASNKPIILAIAISLLLLGLHFNNMDALTPRHRYLAQNRGRDKGDGGRGGGGGKKPPKDSGSTTTYTKSTYVAPTTTYVAPTTYTYVAPAYVAPAYVAPAYVAPAYVAP
jgi:hypothetical protein